jgi:hypothetical protein
MLVRITTVAMLALAGQAMGQCESVKLYATERNTSDGGGFAIGTNGEWLLSGAPFRTVNGSLSAGVAHVYRRNTSTGAWSQINTLQAADTVSNARFGSAIAYNLPNAAIGAPYAGNGAVYTFEHIQNIWTQAKLSGGNPGDEFGAAVDFDGNFLLVGAPKFDRVQTGLGGNVTDAGAAHLYEKVSGVWQFRSTFQNTSSTASQSDLLGSSVALTSDAMALGAPGFNGAAQNCGAVLVFLKLSGTWTMLPMIHPPAAQADADFGAAVALGSDWLAVGAPRQNDAQSDQGVVYIYRRINNIWTPSQTITAPNAAAAEFFGGRLHTDGTRLAISATGSHKVYIYQANAQGTFTQQAVFSDPDGTNGDDFGRGVAVVGTRLFVGDIQDDQGGVSNGGATYAFNVSANVSDSCEGAITVQAGASVSGCTRGMTVDGGTSCMAQAPSGPDVWYSFTPTASGTVNINTVGSNFDTILSIHGNACPGSAANTIVCNDDTSTGVWSAVELNVTAGQTYLIRVAGFNLDSGAFNLNVGSVIGGCYANCDNSTATPVLNVADFTCFLQRFAAGEAYANCDNSTANPTLNVADFTCFLQRFAAGCQ